MGIMWLFGVKTCESCDDQMNRSRNPWFWFIFAMKPIFVHDFSPLLLIFLALESLVIFLSIWCLPHDQTLMFFIPLCVGKNWHIYIHSWCWESKLLMESRNWCTKLGNGWINVCIFIYIYVKVSWNRGTPKSSILVGFSIIINHPPGGYPHSRRNSYT